MVQDVHLAEKRDYSSMAHHTSKWVDNVLGKSYHQYCPGDSWSPSLNVYEDGSGFHIVVDLAGVRANDVELVIEEERLRISGVRDVPEAGDLNGGIKLHLMEIDHGRFCRTLELPPGADPDGIEANYRCGLLWIRLPKTTK